MHADHAALQTKFDRLQAHLLGFIFNGGIELVNVGVNHLALFLSGAHDDVPGFIGLAEIAFIAFGQSTDDVH